MSVTTSVAGSQRHFTPCLEDKNIKGIIENWGDFICLDKDLSRSNSFAVARALADTLQMETIDDEAIHQVNDKGYRVKVSAARCNIQASTPVPDQQYKYTLEDHSHLHKIAQEGEDPELDERGENEGKAKVEARNTRDDDVEAEQTESENDVRTRNVDVGMGPEDEIGSKND